MRAAYTLNGLTEWPESPKTNLLSAIRARLLSRVPEFTGVHLRNAPRKAVYPFIIVNPITTAPTQMSDVAYWQEERIQFTVVSNDDMEAYDLGRDAYDALSPFSTKLTFTDGYEMSRLPGMSVVSDQPDQGRDGKTTWHYIFEYTFLTGREHASV
jgi:hypothetical protein